MAVKGCCSGIRMGEVREGARTFLLRFLLWSIVVATATASGVCNVGVELGRNLELPDRPVQGPICGANSCCGLAENSLKLTGKSEVERFVRDSVAHVVSLFDTRSRRLEDLFKEMMARSKKELHSMFERTYGIIYLQNADVFTDFFGELEKYYLHGGVRLAETMDHFFSILYQRMFKVINAQHDFDEEYLACVARDMAKLKPFGDIPIKLGHMLKRSFAATRIFHKALGKGAQIAERVLRLNLSEECGKEIVKMQYCSYCTDQRGAGPCTSYCSDTLKDCLQYYVVMNEHWDNYLDGLEKVADKLLGPFNIEMVVEPINVKISEAIMNFQDSGAEVSQKVFLECGQPKVRGTTTTSAGADRRRRRRRRSAAPTANQNQEISYQSFNFRGGNKKKHRKTNGNNSNDFGSQSAMEKRITEVKQKIKETRNFWKHLPYQYCNNISTASPSDDGNCWNGTAISSYAPTASPSRQNLPAILSEQQYALNVLITKLQSAFQGNDEELEDDEEEDAIATSGSGSGDGDAEEDEEDNAVDVDGEKEATTIRTTTTEEDNLVRLAGEGDDGPKVVAASASEVAKALLHYVLPIVMVWFGGAVTELL